MPTETSPVKFHNEKHFIACAIQFAEHVRHAAVAHFTEKQDASDSHKVSIFQTLSQFMYTEIEKEKKKGTRYFHKYGHFKCI